MVYPIDLVGWIFSQYFGIVSQVVIPASIINVSIQITIKQNS